MKKTKKALLLAGLLCLPCILGSAGEEAVYGASQDSLPRLVDDGDLLSDEEEAQLTEQLDEVSQRQEMDIVIVTEDSLDGENETAFADDFYDYNGYGFGEDRDGILLLVSMSEHKWAISTTGYGITAFTDAGQEYIADKFTPYLSDEEYMEAFTQFTQLCDEFITQAYEGEPFDQGNLPSHKNAVVLFLISLLGGAVVAFIVTAVMKGMHKTVRSQAAAQDYVRAGSLALTRERDNFLYDHVTRTPKPKDDNKGGGGSSTHTSSSGSSHGGSSGSF